MEQEDVLVGPFDVAHLVSNVRTCDGFHLLFEKWSDLGRDLGVDELKIKELRQDILLNKLQLSDVVAQILKTWIDKEGDNAGLRRLSSAFANNGLKTLAESILKIELKPEALRTIFSGFQYGVQKPVSFFTGREDSLVELHEQLNGNISTVAVVTQMTTISGLGGVGKTELCRMYIEKYKSEYKYILWVTADTRGNIEEAFKNIASDDHLKIPICYENESPKKISQILTEVYMKLKKVKGLVVFDNADLKEVVKDFLPHKFIQIKEAKLRLLITSRDSEWSVDLFHVVKLHGLKENDAFNFVKNQLQGEESKDVEELVELLSKPDLNGDNRCFPLALKQSVAFIKHTKQHLDINYSIKNYLKEYDKIKVDSLDSSTYEEVDSYSYTTYTTWRITVDAIKLSTDGQLALKIFNMMAFLNPEDIQRNLFYPGEDATKIRSAISLLVKYCMIDADPEQNVLSVHRLVQTVTRHNLTEEQNSETSHEVVSVLNEVSQEARILKHAVSVWSHASGFKTVVKQNSNSKYKFGLTPLHLLCHEDYGENTDSAKKLIDTLKLVKSGKKFKKVLNKTDDFDRTALWLAADSGDEDILEYLLRNKANPRIASNMGRINARKNLSSVDKLGQTPLHTATYWGFIKCVQLLLDGDPTLVNVKDMKGRTALDMAVHGGEPEVVKYLSKDDLSSYLFALIRNHRKKASFEKFKEIIEGLGESERLKVMNSKYQNRTLLQEAVNRRHLVPRLKFLVENGVYLRPECGSFTALLHAIYGRHLEAVKYFISLGAHPIFDTNEEGWSGFHAACQHGELEIVKYFLLEFPDLDVNVLDLARDTPLHTAAWHGKLEVVEFLLNQKGLEVNPANRLGMTPICTAACNGNFDVVLLMLEKCPGVKLKPEEIEDSIAFSSSIGLTIAHFAAAFGRLDILEECKKRGMDVDIGKDRGLSPLHFAVFFNQLDALKSLVQAGADIKAEVNLLNVFNAFYKLVENEVTFTWNRERLLQIMRFANRFRNLIHRAVGKLTPISISQLEELNLNEIYNYFKSVTGLQQRQDVQPGFLIKTVLTLRKVQNYLKSVQAFAKQEEYIGKEGVNIINGLFEIAH